MSSANNSSFANDDSDEDENANEGSVVSGSETDDDNDDSALPASGKVSDDSDDSDSSSDSSSSNESDSDSSEQSDSVTTTTAQPSRLTSQQIALLKEKADKLEQELAENPYVYETYAALVDIYKQNDDWWPELDTVFGKFHLQFPLTEHYWLMWLDKRKKQLLNEPDTDSIAAVHDLFEKALLDYLSINLWLEYALFGIRFLKVDQTRSIFTRALKIAGYHFADGSKIWNAYRDFEIINIQKCGNDLDRKRELALRINDLFMDRLKIPQKNLSKIYREWLEFKEDLKFLLNGGGTVPELERNVSFDNIDRLSFEWQSFEDRLKQSTANAIEKFQTYKNYIESVTNEKEYLLSRHKSNSVVCLLERLVSDCCLYSYAWIFYLDCAQKQDGTETDRKSFSMSIVERAVRNIPYDGRIWAYYLTLMDRFDYTHDQITERFETTITTGFSDGSMYVDVWLAYLEHYRRITSARNPETIDRLRKVFEQALDFVQYYDTDCRIARLFAWAQAVYFDDLPQMRQIYTSVLNSGANAQQLEFWLELVTLERQFGDVKHERKTWIRAFENVRDLRQLVAGQWLDFEIKNGSAETVLYCRARINQLNFEKVTSSVARQPQPRKVDGSKTNRKQSQPKNNTSTLKKTVVPAAKAVVTKPQTSENHTFAKPALLCTLFVKGLPANSTTGSIYDLFRAYGVDANSIRTITDRKTQKLKNFAYVDFADKDVAQRAIDELNGKSIGTDEKSVPLFVAFSDPPKKTTESSGQQQQTTSSIMPTQRAAKKKLDCALIPTVLKRQKLNEAEVTETKTGTVSGASTKLSNDDFRKRFLS